jgi:hypothetical protein
MKHFEKKTRSPGISLIGPMSSGGRKRGPENSLKTIEVVRIGTRALISKDGKPLVATHWDGYPSSLGMDLLRCDRSFGAVIKATKKHTIDAAHRSIVGELNKEQVRMLAQKHGLSEQEIKDGKRRDDVIVAEDYEISNIDTYGDWAEYRYDIRGDKIYFRLLDGCWPGSLKNAGGFRLG